MSKNDIEELPDLNIEITDIPEEPKLKTEKPKKSRAAKAPKGVKKASYAAAKKHVMSESLDALYLDSINRLVVKKGNKPISDAHDIGAAMYYSMLYYGPAIPIDHPLTYLIMAGFSCGLDVLGAVQTPVSVGGNKNV